MRSYLLEVITPERLVYRGEVEMLVARGTEGDLGIQAGHESLLTALEIGVVKVRGAEPEKLAVAGGFLAVRPEGVSIVTDTAERSAEIDVLRARAARERAENRLRARQDEGDSALAQAALERALARLSAADRRS